MHLDTPIKQTAIDPDNGSPKNFSSDAADTLKVQAKRLRAALASRDVTVSHAGSLELMAQSYGFRDWNTALAVTRRNSTAISIEDLGIGKRFAGSYLGHAVSGKILGLTRTPVGGVYRIEVHLDHAVDVVASKHFSGFRQRIAARINTNCEPVLASGQRGPGLSVDLLL
ncbi:glyoxalase superfamily protein [Thalassospira mesophila]|uniref:glyoxalase superfamily protein n=1 Tax=Thalassospira mesophila TaxID=1293891 RepID=UPI001FED2440|nr:glyoxalase superfamily protein [Thalassospira mesophila]